MLFCCIICSVQSTNFAYLFALLLFYYFCVYSAHCMYKSWLIFFFLFLCYLHIVLFFCRIIPALVTYFADKLFNIKIKFRSLSVLNASIQNINIKWKGYEIVSLIFQHSFYVNLLRRRCIVKKKKKFLLRKKSRYVCAMLLLFSIYYSLISFLLCFVIIFVLLLTPY